MDAINCNFMVQAKLFLWPWPPKTSPTKSSHRFHLRQVAETCWDPPCISLPCPWLMQSGWAVALAVTACKNAFKPSSSWKPCPSDDLRYLATVHQIAWSISSRSWNMKLWYYVKRQQWQIAHITPHENINELQNNRNHFISAVGIHRRKSSLSKMLARFELISQPRAEFSQLRLGHSQRLQDFPCLISSTKSNDAGVGAQNMCKDWDEMNLCVRGVKRIE